MQKRYKEKKHTKKTGNKYNLKWILLISIWTFGMAIIVSLISENIMRSFDIFFAFLTLVLIILLGVTFDTIGIAVAASDEKPFHAMASNRVLEAKYAVRLVRNAGPVSNFCNDVIGDICGIISGAAGTIIVFKLVARYGIGEGTIVSVVMSGFVASLTVGGKALGKEIGLKKSKGILLYTAKLIMYLDLKLGVSILPNIKRNKR